MVRSLEEFMQLWDRRLRNPIADFIIIWFSAYSTEPVYPYSLHGKLVDLWSDNESPPLQTVYSTINRLEEDGLIESRQEIVDGRVQKILQATEKGFDAIEKMKDSFDGLYHSLQSYEV